MTSIYKKIWLLFAQFVTLAAAVVLVLTTFKPNWNVLRILSEQTSQSLFSVNTALSQGFHLAGQRAMPAVVNIFTAQKTNLPPDHPLFNDPEFRKFFGENDGPFSPLHPNASLGSGVIINPDGYILTNHHVVETADALEVALADGRKTIATLVGSDPETDLAVLKINLENLPSIVFGDNQNARVGDVVLAIGNPFGVGQTLTMGIISALGRNHLGINTFENFIQTDAAINPGNSGGALVDTQGQLLGINTAIYSRSGGSQGIGFAIPANTAKPVMEAIIQFGSVTRGYIGIEPQDITPELAEAFKLPNLQGALITNIMKDGPANKAGLKTGDIILEVDQKKIHDTITMLNFIAQLQPKSICKLLILREGKPLLIEIEIGKRPIPNRALQAKSGQ